MAGLTLLGIFILLFFLSVTEYRPSGTEKLIIRKKGIVFPEENMTFSFLTWNIGYGGLGKEMDFFYDGGKRVRPEKEEFFSYLNGIRTTLARFDSVDFIFLQEIDSASKRSYEADEITVMDGLLPDYAYAFAKNYDCRFIPVPLLHPVGKVFAGLALFTKYEPLNPERIAFNSHFPWPKRLVFLKRCFLVMRFPLENKKELVILNTHNSAFDKGGLLRKEELQRLHGFMISEFNKGNFVVAGGDWNNNPRGYHPGMINSGDLSFSVDLPIKDSFLPGWEFAFDPKIPTNRDVDMPYVKGKTRTTIIDFFVVSPNVKVDFIRTISAGFEYSDHNPVFMKVELITGGTESLKP